MNRETHSAPMRILLVEDSVHDQIAFQRALEKSNIAFEVTVCERSENIPAAMQSGSESFDIVVVDQNLPGFHGLEAYQWMKRKGSMPPFVMLTGTGSENLAVEALMAGMYDYIIKDPAQGYLKMLPLKLINVRQRHRDRIARLKSKADLKKAHAELEKAVRARTKDLAQTVEALQREIDERRETEKDLRLSRQALHILSRKIVETQEDERRQIAKELHDSIGASLAAIKFAIEERLEHMHSSPPEDVISLERIIGHIHDTIREVRRISTSLRPSMLDDLGLLATIRWYVKSSRELHDETNIEIELDIEEDQIPEVAKIVIYRIMQEALNNALRHSQAENVQIRLTGTGGCVQLCINDDGCGFNLQHAMESTDPLTGYGLKGMQDRADVVQGRLAIDTRPGMGTAVCLVLPLETIAEIS
jgi:signal transduction histidine kinase